MCISISYVTMYLFEPLHSSFTCPIFFLRAGVFLCFFSCYTSGGNVTEIVLLLVV